MAQRVEVHHPALGVNCLDSGAFQVLGQHLGRSPVLGHAERRRVGHLEPQVLAQLRSGIRAQGQRVAAAVLRVTSLHGDGCLVCIELEVQPAQGAQFIGAQAGLEGQAVQQGALGAWHAESLRACLGCRQQCADLVHLQGAAFTAAVGDHVEPGQVGERVFRGAAFTHHPAPELRHGLAVVVHRLRGGAGLLLLAQPGGNAIRAGFHLLPVLEAQGVEAAGGALHRLCGVGRG
ncbi:MAG: hypothetical protein M5U25_07295 [Planctomycetota bacterium]|nr:hypothetical protein [Planctomycetota bacterium]